MPQVGEALQGQGRNGVAGVEGKRAAGGGVVEGWHVPMEAVESAFAAVCRMPYAVWRMAYDV